MRAEQKTLINGSRWTCCERGGVRAKITLNISLAMNFKQNQMGRNKKLQIKAQNTRDKDCVAKTERAQYTLT